MHKELKFLKAPFLIKSCIALLAFNCLTMPIVKGQVISHNSILNLDFLQYGAEVPKELLSAKTAVLIDDQMPSLGRPTWQTLAQEAHTTFHRLGIDAVAYYDLNVVLSGTPVARSFAQEIKNRGILYALILHRSITVAQDTAYTLTLGKISEQDLFFEAGQPAFRLHNNQLAALMQSMVRAVSSSGLERANFLILEKPEFFQKTNIFAARRFENYNPDLKLDRLAVPLFEERKTPAKTPSGMSGDEVSYLVERENQKVMAANERLREVMTQYPFASGPVSQDITEAEMRRDGYLFILQHVYGKASTVRDILQYNFESTEQVLTSTTIVGGDTITKALPTEEAVYKFYVKHLPTGEVFLGSQWDADTTWEAALENFINNLKFALKVQ